MTRILSLLFLLGLTLNCIGQSKNGIPEYRRDQLDTLTELLKNERILGLADRMLYPIKRPNPVPDIETIEQFILYYPTLFDSVLKKMLISTNFDSSNTIDRTNGFGILNGYIWLDHDGRVITINYKSEEEIELLNRLHQEIENKIHSSINNWKLNILVCQTDKFVIRIDLMDDNELRYVSWSKPKNISSKPDLVLFDGKQELQGTMGGITYTFKRGDWTYTINRIEMAESDDELGLYLNVYDNVKLKMNIKTEEIK